MSPQDGAGRQRTPCHACCIRSYRDRSLVARIKSSSEQSSVGVITNLPLYHQSKAWGIGHPATTRQHGENNIKEPYYTDVLQKLTAVRSPTAVRRYDAMESKLDLIKTEEQSRRPAASLGGVA